MPAGDEQMPSFSLNSAALATSIYFTVPGRPSSSTRSATASASESPAQERVRWMQAFERSYLFALRSLSFPSHLNIPITMNERLGGTGFLDVGVVPKSPSEQQLDRIDDATNVTSAKPGGAQAEREERAYWAVRLRKVRKELEGIPEGKVGGKASGGVGTSEWAPPKTVDRAKLERRRSSIKLGLGLGTFGIETNA